MPKSVSHPTQAIADTGNINKPGAHARAWGAALVSNGVLKKATGGEGWVVNGNSPKHQYWYSNAGTGEFLIPTTSPDITVARVQLVIQQSGEATNPSRPTDAPSEVGQYPSQGMFVEDAFVVQLILDASIQQLDAKTEMFHGKALLNGPETANPGLQPFGDFETLNVFEETRLNGNPGQVRFGALVDGQVIPPTVASVLTNTPFTVNLDMIMSQYEIGGFPFEPPLVDTKGILAASSGDFVVEMQAFDAQGNPLNITAVVPEPASLALALGTALGAFTMLRRCRIR